MLHVRGLRRPRTQIMQFADFSADQSSNRGENETPSRALLGMFGLAI
jgi:hypothetical protein